MVVYPCFLTNSKYAHKYRSCVGLPWENNKTITKHCIKLIYLIVIKMQYNLDKCIEISENILFSKMIRFLVCSSDTDGR